MFRYPAASKAVTVHPVAAPLSFIRTVAGDGGEGKKKGSDG